MNIAARHESSGIVGGVNVSASTKRLAMDFFEFLPLGEIEIKGGERLEMFELLGIKSAYRDGKGAPNGDFRASYLRLR